MIMEVLGGSQESNRRDIKYLVGELYDIFSSWTRKNKKIPNPTTEEDEKINKKEKYRECQLIYNLASLNKFIDLYINSDAKILFKKWIDSLDDIDKFEGQRCITNINFLTSLYLLVNVDEKRINKRIDAWDMNTLDNSLYNWIKITKPIRIKANGRQETDAKELISVRIWWKNFLKAVRDAIDHRGFIQNYNGIYINYSNCIPTERIKWKEDLECFITTEFIFGLLNIFSIDRKRNFITCNANDLNFSNIYNNYQSNRNKIILHSYNRTEKDKWSTSGFIDEDLKAFHKKSISSKSVNKGNIEKETVPDDVFTLLDDFFKKYKWDEAHLRALLPYLSNTNIIRIGFNFFDNLAWTGFGEEFRNKSFDKIMLRYRDIALKDFKKNFWEKSFQYIILSTFTEWEDPSQWDIRVNKNALKSGLRKIKYFKKTRLTKQEETKIISQILSAKKRFSVGKAEWEMTHSLFPNYILYLYIAYWYLNDPTFTPVGKHNIIPEKEHIRNAIAHQNVFMLPGVDQIILWDPTQDNENSDWCKTYNLSDLFETAWSEYTSWAKDNLDLLLENWEFLEYLNMMEKSLLTI